VAIGQRPAPASVEINGVVRYAEGNNPADKILVRLEFSNGGVAGQTLTDRTGKFQFTGLTPAIYVLTIRATGYKDLSRQIDLQTAIREYAQFQLIRDATESSKPADAGEILDARIPPEALKEFEQGKVALLEAKKIEEGLAHLEKAVKLYPEYLDAHILLGTAYMDARRFDKAERELHRSLELEPRSSVVYFTLGELYRRQNKDSDAIKAQRRCRKVSNTIRNRPLVISLWVKSISREGRSPKPDPKSGRRCN
jgi:tetratricopeptide (TPR) repeat protein